MRVTALGWRVILGLSAGLLAAFASYYDVVLPEWLQSAVVGLFVFAANVIGPPYKQATPPAQDQPVRRPASDGLTGGAQEEPPDAT